MNTIKILKISLLSLLCCTSCTGQDNNNMDKLIKAVIKQDKGFLKKNLTSENINTIYDFSIISKLNVHLSDGTERSEFVAEDEKGTLLHLTAWYNLPNSAKILIEKGADVNAKDEEGRTPLEVAANRYDVVTYPVQRVLIENNADMNFYVHKHLLNHPLLFCYIHWEQFELAKLAIENGADVNMATNARTTILEFAEERGTPEIVSMLKAKDARYSEKYLREREQEREKDRLYQEYKRQKEIEGAEAERRNQERLESVLDKVIIRTSEEVEADKNRQKQEILIDSFEEQALFDGKPAYEAFPDYVNKNIIWTKLMDGMSGHVFVEFDIETDGLVSNAKIIHGVNAILDAEALRVIRASPKWTPAKIHDKPVSVKYVCPVIFRFEKQPEKQ